jgi:hypothetical protein
LRKDVLTAVSEIEKEHKFGEELINRWKECKLTLDNDEKVELIQWMISRGFIFGWLDLICYLLPYAIESPLFLDIINSITNKVRHDLAQGPFINTLIEIGEKNPKIAYGYYLKIIEKYPANFGYGGLLLGGAARTDANIQKIILSQILTVENVNCASLLRAIRVYQEKREEVDPELFSIIKILKIKEDINIKNEVILAYLDFYTYNKKESIQNLIEIAQSKSSTLQFILINQLITRKIDLNDICKLVEIISDSSDSKVLEQVGMVLAIQCKHETKFALSIIKKWIESGKFYELNNGYWVLEEIGKESTLESLNIIKNWVGEKYLPFFSGSLFWSIGKHEPLLMMQQLSELLNDNKKKKYALKEIRVILNELFKISTEGNEVVDYCYNILYNLAESEGLDPRNIVKKETNKIFKSCALLNELEKTRNKINFSEVEYKLGKYPNIKTFFGEEWFNDKKNEKNDHPIIELLSIQNINIKTEAFLQYLDIVFSLFPVDYSGINKIKHNIKEKEQFWETISELDIISKLKNIFPLTISPEIQIARNGNLMKKQPDIEVKIGLGTILIEVINPQMFPELYYFNNAGIPNRLASKIYTEFNEHFKGQLINQDVVIAVDIERSEIDYDSAEDYLEGSFQVTFQIESSTGKVISSYPSRAADSMLMKDPDTKSIIGLILYQKIVGGDNRIHLKGRVFPNKLVLNSEREQILSELEKIILG